MIFLGKQARANIFPQASSSGKRGWEQRQQPSRAISHIPLVLRRYLGVGPECSSAINQRACSLAVWGSVVPAPLGSA